VAKTNRVQDVISALRKEESILQKQIGRVRDAIAALGDVRTDYKVRQGVRKAKTVATNAQTMTAAQKKAVSDRKVHSDGALPPSEQPAQHASPGPSPWHACCSASSRRTERSSMWIGSPGGKG
jgi:cell fate (sporulation/competence/biofilm development) regulator YmcA (YheA/YmcA/DUF963 family)